MDRTVRVRLEAAIAGYQAGMAKAKASTQEFGREVGHAARTSKQEMQTVGTVAAVTGAAIAGGLALAGKAAVDFESSFAGVRKTVDASEPEFARLADGMRTMAREIPTGVNELNAIGEAAGQLGIETDNLLGFTRTMADLGETTNLSADEAATSLARLANITQMPQAEFGRLGSTVVALGNSFATTEAEIVEMGQRIAGAGAQVGMTEPQIMAVAAALSSLGINAEAGGTAISKVMIDIASQVENGGDKLATFAQVAGMTADEFATAFRDDAAGALGEFVTGLGRMEQSGGSTLGVLEDLEITEVRMRDALLRASGAGDLWAEAGDTANKAWEDNVALTDEAAQRYDTVGAKIDIARSAINDAAITIGDTFAPAIGGAADMTAGFAGIIADMPGPLAGVVTGVGGLAGAASLAAGGFLLAAPRIVETKDALATLAKTSPRAIGGLRAVGSFLTGPWGLAIGGAITAVGLFAKAKADHARESEAFAATLDQETAAITENTEAQVLNRLETEGAIQSARDLGIATDELVAAVLGDADAFARVNAELEATANEAAPSAVEQILHLGGGVSDTEVAARGLQVSLGKLAGEFEVGQAATRRKAEETARLEGAYVDMAHALDSGLTPAEASLRAEMGKVGLATEGTADAMGDGEGAAFGLAAGLDATGGAAEDALTPLEDFRQSIEDIVGVHLNAAQAEIAWEQAIDDLVETLGEGKKSLDRNTQAGRDNERQVIDSMNAAFDHGKALMEEGASAEDAARAVHDHIDELRQQMLDAGFAKDAVDKLIASYGATPSEVYTKLVADSGGANETLDAFQRRLNFLTGQTWNVRMSATYGYVARPPGSTGGAIPAGGGAPITQHSGGTIHAGMPRWPWDAPDERTIRAQVGEVVIPAGHATSTGAVAAGYTGGGAGGPRSMAMAGSPASRFEVASSAPAGGGGSVTHVTTIELDGRVIGRSREVFDGLADQNQRTQRRTGGVGL